MGLTLENFKGLINKIGREVPWVLKSTSKDRQDWYSTIEKAIDSLDEFVIDMPYGRDYKFKGFELSFEKGQNYLSTITKNNLQKITDKLGGVTWKQIGIRPSIQLGNGLGSTRLVYSYLILGAMKNKKEVVLFRRESKKVSGGVTEIYVTDLKRMILSDFLYTELPQNFIK